MHQSSSTYRPSTTNATLSAAIPRFDFAGKEKDLETGLSYFGARYSTSFRDVSWQRPQASLGALLLKRYYDADLTTGWLSVDPMADKYPSMSPYNYCAGNPVKLVDPDGREWDPSSLEIVNQYKDELTKRLDETSDNNRNEIQAALNELEVLTSSNQMYHVEVGEVETPRVRGETGWDYDNNRVSITLSENYSLAEIGHEMKHAYQFEIGEISYGKVIGQPNLLYDFYDEKAAHNRGVALGGEAMSDTQIKYYYFTTHKDDKGKSYNCYPFLTQEEVCKWHSMKTRDFGQNRTRNLNSINYNHLSTQIYRKDGVTHGI